MGLTLANKITIGRIVLIPVFIAVMLSYSPERAYLLWWALGIYILAEITDIIDGYIARRYYQKTKAGSILDPLADKFLLISALIVMYAQGARFDWAVQFPLWLVVTFVARDVILILGGLLIELKSRPIEIRPNLWGKLTAFLQVVCVVAVFLQFHMAYIIWWLAVAAAVISGLIYMKEGIKVLNDEHA
ncbi:MAG: CDP-diacylglycerol--glycerol-3-phosphate 3-phosphatidyltransferase [Candidatus Omnitrophica bacterium]|nr:CDP-diacylglycerol--glycerol-3-phosphate 3-phosphatidyltransferase [Candidatus Omnitrophota bacterium]